MIEPDEVERDCYQRHQQGTPVSDGEPERRTGDESHDPERRKGDRKCHKISYPAAETALPSLAPAFRAWSLLLQSGSDWTGGVTGGEAESQRLRKLRTLRMSVANAAKANGAGSQRFPIRCSSCQAIPSISAVANPSAIESMSRSKALTTAQG